MKKSILLFTVIAAVTLTATNVAQAQEAIDLFNGKDLSNWSFIVNENSVPAEEVFSIRDGVIHIKGEPLGYMYTKQTYENYQLHVEWRWPQEASNSGIFIMIEETESGNPFPNGIEIQLAAGKAGDFVCLGGSNLLEYQQPPGSPAPRFPMVTKASESSEKPVGEWNEANIWVKDGRITVFVNGVYQNSGTNPVKSGHIGLQSEGKDVEFRNVILTPWQ